MSPHRIHYIPLCLHHVAPVRKLAQRLGTKVAGQHNQRLLEVDLATLTVGQHTIVQDLQQDVEHIGVRFFDLVEQHNLIRATPHSFGQHTAFVIADIPRRRTDQT